MRKHAFPKLHNAMWPGMVGKGPDAGQEPPISFDRMLAMTADAEVDGQKFDGIDFVLGQPHADPDASDDDLRRIADQVAGKGLAIGSLGAPIWSPYGGSAMGSEGDREKFLAAVKKTCHAANVFRAHGVRKSGIIRIDSAEFGVETWGKDAVGNTRLIVDTFREAGKIAGDRGERLGAEGEICWAGIHSWQHLLNVLHDVNMPGVVGTQTDMSHTLTFALGINAPEHKLLDEGFSDDQLDAAWKKLSDALRLWTFDFHVAQSDGRTRGAGAHAATGKHCPADDPNGKLDVVKHAGFWLNDAHGIPMKAVRHICWDGCMFPNTTLEDPKTWNTILGKMIEVREAHGWN